MTDWPSGMGFSLGLEWCGRCSSASGQFATYSVAFPSAFETAVADC